MNHRQQQKQNEGANCGIEKLEEGEEQKEQQQLQLDLSEHISCPLCGDFLSDAVTLTGCLHFFCRVCLLRHLSSAAPSSSSTTNAITAAAVDHRCPKCHVQLGPEKPFFRADRALQELVYNLVPDLFWRRLRRIARSRSGQKLAAAPAQQQHHQHLLQLSSKLCSSSERISIRLDYVPLSEVLAVNRNRDYSGGTELAAPSTSRDGHRNSLFSRFFRCPARARVEHLKRLLELKLAMTEAETHGVYLVDAEMRNVLEDDYTMEDLVHLFNWDRKAPLALRFTLVRLPQEEEDKPPVLEEMPQLELEEGEQSATQVQAVQQQQQKRAEQKAMMKKNEEGQGRTVAAAKKRKRPVPEVAIPVPPPLPMNSSNPPVPCPSASFNDLPSIPSIDQQQLAQAADSTPSSSSTNINNANIDHPNGEMQAEQMKTEQQQQMGPVKKRRKTTAAQKKEMTKEEKEAEEEEKMRKKQKAEGEKAKKGKKNGGGGRDEEKEKQVGGEGQQQNGMEGNKEEKSGKGEGQKMETEVKEAESKQEAQKNGKGIYIDGQQPKLSNGPVAEAEQPVQSAPEQQKQQQQAVPAMPKKTTNNNNRRPKQAQQQKTTNATATNKRPTPPQKNNNANAQVPMPPLTIPPGPCGMFPPTPSLMAAALPYASLFQGIQGLMQNGAMAESFNAYFANAFFQQQQSIAQQQMGQMFSGMATAAANNNNGARKPMATTTTASGPNNNHPPPKTTTTTTPNNGGGKKNISPHQQNNNNNSSQAKLPARGDRPSMVGQAPTSTKYPPAVAPARTSGGSPSKPGPSAAAAHNQRGANAVTSPTFGTDAHHPQQKKLSPAGSTSNGQLPRAQHLPPSSAKFSDQHASNNNRVSQVAAVLKAATMSG